MGWRVGGARWTGVVVLSLLASGARGDYLEDRKQTNGAPGVRRLWIGKQNDGTCRIQTVDDCIKAQGQPTRREHTDDGAEKLVYEGTKYLYRGTGSANECAGYERVELTVRKGTVFEGFRTVQIVELGRPSDSNGRQTCEPYGAKNTAECVGVEPMEEPPPLVAEKKPADYACVDGKPAAAIGTRTVTPIDPKAFVAAAQDTMSGLVDGARFTLTVKAGGELPPPPFFLGHDPAAKSADRLPPPMKTQCAVSARFAIVAHENQIGSVAIGVCDRTRELTPKAVCDAKGSLGPLLPVLEASRERATPGLEPDSEHRDGLDVEYIPIVLVGQGVAMLPTIVITRPAARDAIVVQYLPDDTCQPSDLPFCGVDMRPLLARIGAQVAQRYLPT
jgi:hypothetical protein